MKKEGYDATIVMEDLAIGNYKIGAGRDDHGCGGKEVNASFGSGTAWF